VLNYQNKSFENISVRLDGGVFETCSFRGCTLIFAGGSIPVFSECGFEGCRWQFEEAAGRTVAFIRAVADVMGPEGPPLIQDLFPRSGPLDRARQVLDSGRNRFLVAMKERKIEVPQVGFRECAFIIDGEVPQHSPTESFLRKLFAAQPQHTGWPAWVDSRSFPEQADQPNVHDEAWQTLIADKQSGPFEVPHLEFWRMDPKGIFYLLRALEDDLPNPGPGPRPKPGAELDFGLQVTRVAEIISVALSFGKSMGCSPLRTSLAFAFRWSKLKGRHLTSWIQPQRAFHSRGPARQDEALTAVTLALDTPHSAVAPHVESALRNLFALFGGMEFSSEVIGQIVTERLGTHF
jgi:hypothetical protein